MAAAEREIRVLIVDDDRVLVDALTLVMGREPNLTVVGAALTVREALARATSTKPNVILLDFHLPDGTGAEATRRLVEAGHDAAIVVMTIDESDDTLLAAIDAGATGFLLKRDGLAKVVRDVRRAAGGEMLVLPETMLRLLAELRTRERVAAERSIVRERFTGRELETLQLMAEGLDTKAIAARLVVSGATVRSHVQGLLGKLDAHSRLEAVARASRIGLLDR